MTHAWYKHKHGRHVAEVKYAKPEDFTGEINSMGCEIKSNRPAYRKTKGQFYGIDDSVIQ